MINNKEIIWLPEVKESNYIDAESYLNLIYLSTEASQITSYLREEEIVEFKAKDILRASRLTVLTNNNYHVKLEIENITQEIPLSPLLLVRDKDLKGKLIIADGYHRLCAVYNFNEDFSIHCKIIGV
jgi:hypothetical protein